MSRITGKRQVTVPKHIADRYGLGAGSEIEWVAEDDGIRVYLASSAAANEEPTVEERLRWFDQATERQARRQAAAPEGGPGDRGWTREELYERGVPR